MGIYVIIHPAGQESHEPEKGHLPMASAQSSRPMEMQRSAALEDGYPALQIFPYHLLFL